MLKFRTLTEWRAWQQSQEPRVRNFWRTHRPHTSTTTGIVVQRWGAHGEPTVAIACDSTTPSAVAAVIAPARELLARKVNVVTVSTAPLDMWLGTPESSRYLTLPAARSAIGSGLRAIVTLGDHLPLAATLHHTADTLGIASYVAQHGVITPFSPPPPAGSVLMCWSQADADFVAAGRDDLTVTVTGSQLLWEARSNHRASDTSRSSAQRSLPSSTKILFLGQLHGAELPRRRTQETVHDLRRSAHVTYQRHPAETDLLSRLQHRMWQASGTLVVSDDWRSGNYDAVVSHFSTGILEGAASGLSTFAYCARPPDWLPEVWHRYGMARWLIDPHSTDVGDLVSGSNPAECVAAIVAESVS